MVGRDADEGQARPASARCRDVDTEVFFPVAEAGPVREGEVARAKVICSGCPVRAQCLDWAIVSLPHGVAGGLDEHERAELRRGRRIQRPDGMRPTIVVPVGARDLPPRERGEVIAAGRRALADGIPRPRVAVEFGVSRRTVDRWAAGLSCGGVR
ncbi:WhiB family transcriptional regulator [Pseudonocardia sp. WMMC193]|uniref:WhiB family transcriptional regulator n=1 Tax=Pseudonocardia sp. WMMC193 TaxID=2911965 RepID=UPI0027E07D27|nr:WhiB family transcriptional regulator [Pseudonocardia sp. WMMC193]